MSTDDPPIPVHVTPPSGYVPLEWPRYKIRYVSDEEIERMYPREEGMNPAHPVEEG